MCMITMPVHAKNHVHVPYNQPIEIFPRQRSLKSTHVRGLVPVPMTNPLNGLREGTGHMD